MFRLKELRLNAGLKRCELADTLKINRNTLANYENETRQASYETLVRLADYFDESVDYLLGVDAKNEGEEGAAPKAAAVFFKAERSLIALYRDCNAKGKARILEYVEMIKNNPVYTEEKQDVDK